MEGQYKFVSLSYIAKNTRIKGESLSAFGQELKRLTDEDKKQLDEWALQELEALNGEPV